jgi:hypothetical protein
MPAMTPSTDNSRAGRTYSRHTAALRPIDTACGRCAPFGRARCPACLRRPPAGSASAVPDLTLTPRGPRGRGRERLRHMVVQAGGGGNHRGTCPYSGSPRFPPASLFLQPFRPTRRAASRANLLARAGRRLTRNYSDKGAGRCAMEAGSTLLTAACIVIWIPVISPSHVVGRRAEPSCGRSRDFTASHVPSSRATPTGAAKVAPGSAARISRPTVSRA